MRSPCLPLVSTSRRGSSRSLAGFATVSIERSPTPIGGWSEVGNFNEQNWGDLHERGQRLAAVADGPAVRRHRQVAAWLHAVLRASLAVPTVGSQPHPRDRCRRARTAARWIVAGVAGSLH